MIEHFDALTAIDPRPDAPAILLMDDKRRCVHATPAAARFSGRSLARLLTMRVDDVTRPSERDDVPEPGTASWRRLGAGPLPPGAPGRLGGEVLYSAKANSPWPGSHASLLVPADQERELDVDRALVEAGLVRRYAPPG